jgi:hypothetical protein
VVFGEQTALFSTQLPSWQMPPNLHTLPVEQLVPLALACETQIELLDVSWHTRVWQGFDETPQSRNADAVQTPAELQTDAVLQNKLSVQFLPTAIVRLQ